MIRRLAQSKLLGSFPRPTFPRSSPYSAGISRIFLYAPCSTSSTPGVEYKYIGDVERLEYYAPGGYHPIQINDTLHTRYRIIHKLGHGTFSTAWLALDQRAAKYVAIKIGTADADRQEEYILSQLTTNDPGIAADKASMMPVLLDRFNIDGPNGTHVCFVTVPARCSLMEAREASGQGLLQLDVAWSLTAQLVLAISLVHSQGFAHGGV
ncbi:hypothetical protein J1614_010641 [Plenodomus biglobosus]|nr:hypothetical protein J1614_010641 [Plenodomus biglobosus]